MLVKCQGMVDSVEYQRILREGLLTALNRNEIFQEDGAPCHRSASTQTYLDSKGICVMSDWPPQLPDINIIEPMWCVLKERVAKRQISSKYELWQACLEEWHSIPNETIIHL